MILPLDPHSKGEPRYVLRALESGRMRQALYTEMFPHTSAYGNKTGNEAGEEENAGMVSGKKAKEM